MVVLDDPFDLVVVDVVELVELDVVDGVGIRLMVVPLSTGVPAGGSVPSTMTLESIPFGTDVRRFASLRVWAAVDTV